jgi:hypothetical protein
LLELFLGFWLWLWISPETMEWVAQLLEEQNALLRQILSASGDT